MPACRQVCFSRQALEPIADRKTPKRTPERWLIRLGISFRDDPTRLESSVPNYFFDFLLPLDFLAEDFFEPTLDLLAEEDLPFLDYWPFELLSPPPLPPPVDLPTGFRAPSKNGDLGSSETLSLLLRLGRSPD
jgi:hypothetical protein